MPALTERLTDASKHKLRSVQEYFSLAGKALRFVFARPFYGQDLVQQMDAIGVQSLGIVLLTGFFTGMVLALQSACSCRPFGATMYIGRLVSGSMIRELGPVLAGLMVAGRVGSGIAAQLGSMHVTEQIDALNTLGTDPIKKLVTPRVLAALIMLPVLTIINDVVGIIGGNLIASSYVGVPSGVYWRTVWEQIAVRRLHASASSPTISSRVSSSRSCSAASSRSRRATTGLNTTGGTEGVGQSTTRTVVHVEHPDPRDRLLHHADPALGAHAMTDDARDPARRHPAANAVEPAGPPPRTRETRAPANADRMDGARANAGRRPSAAPSARSSPTSRRTSTTPRRTRRSIASLP